MRNPILLLASLPLALAACRHLPPDLEARAAVRPPASRRAPTPGELRGAWIATTIRGALGGLGRTALYVFGPEGRYSGAFATDEEARSVEGAYRYEEGRLELDGGFLVLTATLVDGVRLELWSDTTFLALERPPASGRDDQLDVELGLQVVDVETAVP